MKIEGVDIRKDKNGLLLDSGGSPILAFLSKSAKTGRWEDRNFLGEKGTLDEDGKLDFSFRKLVPDKETYGYNIIKSAVIEHFGTVFITGFKVVGKEDEHFVGRFKKDEMAYIVVFKFGDDFDSDEIYIEEIKK